MRLTLATILLALSAPLALAQQLDDDALTRGLLNLATMRQLAAALDYQHVVHGAYQLGNSAAETATLLGVDPAQLRDPWGTPYRIDLTAGGYRIAGAGSDRAFDESSWATRAETTTLAADCVIAGGAFVRSNRGWLGSLVTEAQKNEQNLGTAFPRGDVYRIATTPGSAWAWLRINEIVGDAMVREDPYVVGVMRERITMAKIKALAEQFLEARGARNVRGARVVDEWGTPLAVTYVDGGGQHFRIASAGADKAFDQASWSRPITPSPNDDLVIEDGSWTRVHDLDVLAKAFLPPELQAHPGVTRLKTTAGQQIYKVGGDVAAPVALVRGDVPYPPELDGGRKIGVAEVTIDANGKVVDVKPMLGLSPAADKMIADAMRSWEFKPATRAGQPVAVVYNVMLSLAPH